MERLMRGYRARLWHSRQRQTMRVVRRTQGRWWHEEMSLAALP